MTILHEDEKMNVNDDDGNSKSLDVLENMFLESASFYSDPEKYLEPSDTMRKEVLAITKKMYDFMKDYDIFSNQNSLNELLVSGFDNEQIWQEIQLQNTPFISKTKTCLKALDIDSVKLIEDKRSSVKQPKADKKRKKERRKSAKRGSSPGEENLVENDFDEEMSDEEKAQEPKKKYKKTVVDDGFFRLREMEEYVDRLDRMEEMKDDKDVLDDEGNDDEEDDFEDEIDFFKENIGSSDEEEDEENVELQYNDFFDPPDESVKKTVTKKEDMDETAESEEYEEEEEEEGEYEGGNENDDNEDVDINLEEENESGTDVDSDAEEMENLKGSEDLVKENEKTVESTFERKQRLMQDKIKRLEEENLNEKPWQLMGEADAKKRPVNSLLEEYVTFDVTSAGAPVITEETTLSLEDLIKRRIKDKAWDDVLRKEKPSVQPYEFKRAPELNQEKSKLSLAEVYEKEYLKQAETDKEEKENEEHVNIQKLMDRLFVQLDALSNFHFTPKPPQPEIKIITNVPSLQMEEMLPVTMSEASQLAPEEVFEKKKGELVGDEEKTTQGRKRERRQKKIKKKFAAKERERKEKLKAQKAGKIAKSETKQAMDSLKKGVRNTIVNSSKSDSEKNVKSSNKFFNKLQNEVKNNISKENMKPSKKNKKQKTAESLKL